MIIEIIGILVIAFIVFGCIYVYRKEKKNFNDGICPNCRTFLRHFDDDSQGGQGWTCDHCDYVTWISWFKGE